MKRALRFRAEVSADIRAACHWYDSKRAGLGQDFLNELQAALGRVSETPEIYAAGYRDVRSVRMRRFPYVIHFRLESETIVILAIVYGGRDPSSWQSRA